MLALFRPTGVLVVVLLLLASSCENGTVTVNYPSARTPELVRVERGVVGQPRELVNPNDRGQYAALPASSLFVRAVAPYPVKAEVSINDEVLEEAPDPARQDELEGMGKAYFVVLEIVLNDERQLFDWQFLVFVPPALRTVPGFALAIKTISYDPNAAGQSKVSDPLVLAVVGPCASKPPIPQKAQAYFYQVDDSNLNYASTSPNPTELDPCGKKTVVITSIRNYSKDVKGKETITIDLTYQGPNGKEVNARLKPTEVTDKFNGLVLDNQWRLRVQFVSVPLIDPSGIQIEISWKPQ